MTKSLGSNDRAALVLAGLGLAGSPLPGSLAKLIRKQASVREAGVCKSPPVRCLEAECDLKLDRGLLKKGLPSLVLVLPKVL